ncbi:Peptidase C13, legumain [Candidatus Magnetomorum sp. HK-1]|nr:Peptidase C13, legumain [Candidatus Magnetomorum sp. HK-1]
MFKHCIIIESIIISLFFYFPSLIQAEEQWQLKLIWPAYEHPWYFYAPTDVAVFDNQFVYVVDSNNDCIQKFTTDGSFITKWGRSGSGEGEFNTPIGIAIDRNGYVYITDTTNNRIQKFSSNGDFILSWGDQENEDIKVDHPHGIASDNNHFIYVADSQNNRILKFDSNGKYLTQWSDNFNFPEDIVISPDNYVYVADTKNSKIKKYNPYGVFQTAWTMPDWQEPLAICVDEQGQFYITSKYEHNLMFFDSEMRFKQSAKIQGIPYGLSVAHNMKIYLADLSKHSILQYSSSGQCISSWGVSNNQQGFFNSPQGIAISDDGYIFVADTNNHRIQKFDSKGNFVSKWGNQQLIEPLKEPCAVTINHHGHLFVGDKDNQSICIYDLDGTFVNVWNINVCPVDIAVDRNDNIYVANELDIRKYNPDGDLLNWHIEQEHLTDSQPLGIELDSNDNIYLAIKHCIKKFDSNGTFLLQWGNEGQNNGEFNSPKGIEIQTVDHAETVFIADSENHRIQQFTTDGAFITSFGSSGSSPGQMNSPGALAIHPNGNIYITDTDNHRVQVFEKKEMELVEEKAIIVAGGGSFSGNRIWDTTQACANFAYRTLIYKNFRKQNIRYLSANTMLDLDNDTISDTVIKATNENLKNVIIDWSNNAKTLIIYLVDHGGNKTFRMSGAETLLAEDLNSWIDLLQNQYAINIIFVYDACNSGSFIQELQPKQDSNKRLIITSTSSDEKAYFLNQGSLSFSNLFWTNIFQCFNITDSFNRAKNALFNTAELQKPLLESNINTDLNIGNCLTVIGESPQVTCTQNPDTLTFKATVSSPYSIHNVWAVFVPEHNLENDVPVSELPTVDFVYSKNEYIGTYDHLMPINPNYILIFVKDQWGHISTQKLPAPETEENGLKNRAIIIEGFNVSDIGQKNVIMAYSALRFQGYEEKDILVISASNNNEIMIDKIQSALTKWLQNNTDQFVLYFTGSGKSNEFQVNLSESLTKEMLNDWLLQIQEKVCSQIIIIDSDYSGSFMDILASNDNRMVITSTANDQSSRKDISFSAFFWNGIYSGNDIQQSFQYARGACGFFFNSFYDKGPQMISYSNSIIPMRNFQIGLGIQLGTGIQLESPSILQTPSIELNNIQSPAIIWADNFETQYTIQNVWANIIFPDFNNEQTTCVFQPVENNSFKGECDYFNQFGIYDVTIYATDAEKTFLHKSTKVFQTHGKDIYEDDNNLCLASHLSINAEQFHSLHNKNDIDWVKFFVQNNIPYKIRLITTTPDSCQLIMNIYDFDHNLLFDNIDSCFFEYQFPIDGIYYLKVFANSSNEDQVIPYRLEIFSPDGIFTGIIKGVITDPHNQPIQNALVKTNFGVRLCSLENGGYRMIHEPQEKIEIAVQANGFVKASKVINLQEEETKIENFILQVGDSESNVNVFCTECLQRDELIVNHSNQSEEDIKKASCFISTTAF